MNSKYVKRSITLLIIVDMPFKDIISMKSRMDMWTEASSHNKILEW